MADQMPKAILVCTVGTTFEPVRLVIERAAKQGVQRVCLLYGREIKQNRAPLQVANEARELARSFGCIVNTREISDPQDIHGTVRETRLALEAWAKGQDKVVADLTGGTKVMSAALLYAVVGLESIDAEVGYVGGDNRDELGRVGTGGTVMRLHLSRLKASEALDAFKLKRYSTAYHLTQRLPVLGRVGAIRNLLSAYQDWDSFSYVTASDQMSNLRRRLEVLEDDRELAPLLELLTRLEPVGKELKETLRLVDSPDKARALRAGDWMVKASKGLQVLAADALANAERRQAEGRPTDAALRSYRGLEVAAQAGLLAREINPWNPDWQRMPLAAQEVIRRHDGRLPPEIALGQAMSILGALGVLGDEERELLRDIQQLRNFSFLEHGYSVVKAEASQDAIDKAYKLASKACGVDLRSSATDLQFP